MAPEEESTEDRLGHDIEDTVEDGLRVRGNDIATLRQTPGDGVEEPEEDGPRTADKIGLADVGTERVGVFASSPGHGPGNPEESYAAKDEVAPLFALSACTLYGITLELP